MQILKETVIVISKKTFNSWKPNLTFPESPVGLAIMIMQFSIRASIIKGKLKKPKGTVDISKVIYQSNFFLIER